MESYTGQVLNNQDVRIVDSLDPLGYKDINTAAAIVTVRDAVTGDPLSTIYSDNLAAPLNNPFNTDSEGGFTFFAKNGLYNIVIDEGTGTEFTIDDISIFDQLDLPTTTDLINGTRAIKSGDIVETSGFTASGDGGKAPWQFKGLTGQTTSQTPAQLGDGLFNDAGGNQFELVKGNFVNPEQLGVDPTGAIDAYLALVALHTYANSSNTKVVATGDYLVNATNEIRIQTNCDYSQATITIPDTVNISILFKIHPSVEFVKLTNPSATNFKKGVVVLPDLVAYPFSTISIISNDLLLNRSGVTPVMKNDVVYHSSDGVISHPLMYDMTDIATITINASEKYTLEFKAPKLIIAEAYITSFIKSERNSVYVYGAGVVNNSTLAHVPMNTYFQPSRVIDNTLDGRMGDPISFYTEDFAYDYSGGHVINPRVINLVSPRTWGGVDGNVYRNLQVDNCLTSRVGAHSMLFGATITNCTLGEKAIQVTGAGLLRIRNVSKVVSSNIEKNIFSIVELRADYGSEWDGIIDIDGFEITGGDTDLTAKEFAVVTLAFDGAFDFAKPMKYPTILIKNGTITASTNASTPDSVYYVEMFKAAQDQTFIVRTMPPLISVENVKVIVPSGSPVVKALPYRSPNVVSANVEGDTNITVKNSGIDYDVSTLPLSTGVGRDLDIQEEAADLASPTHLEHYTFIDKKVDTVFVAPAGWTLESRNCNVYNYDFFENSIDSLGFGVVRDSDIYPGFFSGAAKKAIYNSTTVAAGGSTVISLGGNIVRAVGNSVGAGSSITGLTNTEFVTGFYDGTFYEPL